MPEQWHSKKRFAVLFALLGVFAVLLSACGDDGDEGGDESADTSTPAATTPAEPTQDLGKESEFFNQEDFETQLAQRDIEPEDFGAGSEDYEMAIEPELVDTSEYKTPPEWKVCFSNAALDNPWRQVGFTTMEAQVEATPDIGEFEVLDAEASDETQIADIQTLTQSNCDALIISPNTTATLTPAVERACKTGVPVIVFDRGVNTDCPVTFIHPIGGYAFGADGAEFLVENVEPGGKVLALRILPGVDVLENRWSGAKEIFDTSELEVVGNEFTDGDPAKTKQIVNDYIQREGGLDGIWMDAGATAVAAVEAFEDAGQEIPAFVGEDQLDFLTKWQEEGMTAIAPTYSNFQWRTAIIAAERILNGEEVPKEWVLPQPAITEDMIDDVIAQNEGLPPLHYALCGCEDMEGYPERWGG